MGIDDDAVYDVRLELADLGVETFHDVPSEAFLERLLNAELRVPDVEIHPAMDEGLATLERFVRETREARGAGDSGATVERVRDRLATEYTRVFVGPRPPVLAHESAFRDDTEFIGEGLAAVQDSYAAAGWSSPETYPEEDDFVAVELAFLRHLVERQRAGAEEAVAYERVFLDEHLSRWIDDFAAAVLEETDEDLYRAVALIVQGLIAFEDELVAQMPNG